MMIDVKLILNLYYEGEENPRTQVINGIVEFVVFLNQLQDNGESPKAITIEQIGSVDTYDEGYEIGFEEGKEENQDRIDELESAMEDARDWLESVRSLLNDAEGDLDTAFELLEI